jgi:hypothetical protein
MKTTIEVSGFTITIDEMEGKVMVSAEKDGEVVEEFELESEDFEGAQGGEEMEDDEEMQEFGQEEEEEFGDEEGEEFGEEEEEEMEEEEEQGTLESFSKFVRGRRK